MPKTPLKTPNTRKSFVLGIPKLTYLPEPDKAFRDSLGVASSDDVADANRLKYVGILVWGQSNTLSWNVGGAASFDATLDPLPDATIAHSPANFARIPWMANENRRKDIFQFASDGGGTTFQSAAQATSYAKKLMPLTNPLLWYGLVS